MCECNLSVHRTLLWEQAEEVESSSSTKEAQKNETRAHHRPLLLPSFCYSSSSPLTTLHSSVSDAIASLPSSSSSKSKAFLIGGSQLYTLALTSTPSPLVDRILLTRISSPAFEDCDAFLHEFRGGEKSGWKRSSQEELSAFVGFEVEAGEREEKGVKYEFEMWVWEGQSEN